MSREAWGDGDDGMDGYVTEDRAQELAIQAAAVMREMLARFVEVESPTIAASIRANWIPSWGEDPGKWEGEIPESIWNL
jgi:hypothetical protein